MSDEVVAPDSPAGPTEEEDTGKEMDTVGKESGFLNFSDMQSKDFVPLAAMTDSNSNLPVSDMPSLDSRKEEEEEAKEMVTVDNDSTFVKFEDMNSRDFRALDSVGEEPAPSALADVEPVKQIQFAELGSDDDVGGVEMAEIGHNSGVLVDFADMKSTDFPAAVVSLKTPPSLLSGSASCAHTRTAAASASVRSARRMGGSRRGAVKKRRTAPPKRTSARIPRNRSRAPANFRNNRIM